MALLEKVTVSLDMGVKIGIVCIRVIKVSDQIADKLGLSIHFVVHESLEKWGGVHMSEHHNIHFP